MINVSAIFREFLAKDKDFIRDRLDRIVNYNNYDHPYTIHFDIHPIPNTCYEFESDIDDAPDIAGIYTTREAFKEVYEHFMKGDLKKLIDFMRLIYDLFGNDYYFSNKDTFIEEYIEYNNDGLSLGATFVMKWILRYLFDGSDDIYFHGEELKKYIPELSDGNNKCSRCKSLYQCNQCIPIIVSEWMDPTEFNEYDDDEELDISTMEMEYFERINEHRFARKLLKILKDVDIYETSLTFFVICDNCGEFHLHHHSSFKAFTYIDSNDKKAYIVNEETLMKVVKGDIDDNHDEDRKDLDNGDVNDTQKDIDNGYH